MTLSEAYRHIQRVTPNLDYPYLSSPNEEDEIVEKQVEQSQY